MTSQSGDQPPQDPSDDRYGQEGYGQERYGQEQPGSWEQKGQPPGEPPGGAGYGQAPGYPPPGPYAPDHPKATTVLVLGILGIVVCGVIAPFAWVMGRQTLAEIDGSHGRLGGRGAANAGYILGIIGTVLLGLSILMLVVVFGIMGMASLSTY
ncbi:MAG TPA: DUF4190 domain-containing protein [Nocardioidaceae bacterium]|nr:DUF4190 domain-containing protein [Nocardioidaceae bacterium]